MKAINLFALTRDIDNDLFPLYEKSLSQRVKEQRIHFEEIDLIKSIVKVFLSNEIDARCLENWYYSFSIPQIGKEFDLLKIGENGIVINLELKSRPVSEQKIKKQLLQNRYYLSHIADKIYSFTYVKDDDSYSIWTYDDEFRKSSFAEMIRRIQEIDVAASDEIEKWFRPSDYLVSPLNDPEKFLSDKYFLNAQQEEIKKKIISGLSANENLWGIKGGAGTGKTLLLYDIAKTLSENYQICIIHSGILSEGHNQLNVSMKNTKIVDAKSINKSTFESYDIICVDEAHRLYEPALDLIICALQEKEVRGCIFAYDVRQALSWSEINRDNPQRLNVLPNFKEEELTGRIRTNPELFSFIRNMMRLSDKPQIAQHYENIDIVYAENVDESDLLLASYINKGYKFITYTPSQYKDNEIDHYSKYTNSHHVIGQEFDNVVIIMDNNFKYGEDGDLRGRKHPNPDYLFARLFYQNITRAREKLCIIVLGNRELFRTLVMLKENVRVN